MQTEKVFTVRIIGNISSDQLEDAIYQGLQYYEDIEWTTFSAAEEDKQS